MFGVGKAKKETKLSDSLQRGGNNSGRSDCYRSSSVKRT